MSETNFNVLKKIKERNVALVKLEAKNLINLHKKEGTEITQTSKYKYKILEHTDEIFKIRFEAHLFFEPEAIYDIYLEYDLEFRLNGAMDEKEFRKNIRVILSPLGNEISYLTAFLSDRMMDQPLIIAPIIDEDNIE